MTVKPPSTAGITSSTVRRLDDKPAGLAAMSVTFRVVENDAERGGVSPFAAVMPIFECVSRRAELPFA